MLSTYRNPRRSLAGGFILRLRNPNFDDNIVLP